MRMKITGSGAVEHVDDHVETSGESDVQRNKIKTSHLPPIMETGDNRNRKYLSATDAYEFM